MTNREASQRQSPVRGEKGETVVPINTLRLMEWVGPSRASRLLGVSTTTLHKTRTANRVSKVIEVAAEGALLKMEPRPTPVPLGLTPMAVTKPTNSMDVLILEADVARLAMIERLAVKLGATVIKP